VTTDSTARHSTARHGTARHGTTQHSTAHYKLKKKHEIPKITKFGKITQCVYW